MANGYRKRRATAVPLAAPPARMARVPRPSGDAAGSASGNTRAGSTAAGVPAHVHLVSAGAPTDADVPLFDEEEEDVIEPRATAATQEPRAVDAELRALSSSPVSGSMQDTAANGRRAGSWANWLPTVPMLSACWGYFMPRTRAVVKEELIAQDLRREREVAYISQQVADVLLPKLESKIESVSAAPTVGWANRPVEEIRAATSRVFPTKLIRKAYLKALTARMLALAMLLSAEGDVITPFFPPASKLPSSDPFVTRNFNKVILGALQTLYLAIKATGRIPAVLVGKGYVLSSVLDAVDEACLSQLRTFLNDGRAAARAFFYRHIGYFLMNPSPKVFIRLVHPTAPMPDLLDAEDSPYFAVETCHVGSATGVVVALKPPAAAGPSVGGPSGGTFTTVRSAAVGTGLLGLNASVKRDIGTDSSFTSAAGVYYPHVAGEHLIKRTDCLYRLSRGLVQQLLKGSAKVEPAVSMAIAKSARLMISGPAISWTAVDGRPFDHSQAVGPCKWWLLVPRLSTRSALDTKLQTLSAEEQSAHTVGHLPLMEEVAFPSPEADVEEDAIVDQSADAVLDGGSDLELDESCGGAE